MNPAARQSMVRPPTDCHLPPTNQPETLFASCDGSNRQKPITQGYWQQRPKKHSATSPRRQASKCLVYVNRQFSVPPGHEPAYVRAQTGGPRCGRLCKRLAHRHNEVQPIKPLFYARRTHPSSSVTYESVNFCELCGKWAIRIQGQSLRRRCWPGKTCGLSNKYGRL